MGKNYYYKAFIAICICALQISSVFAQCNSFVKKRCLSKMQPFTNNGQVNTSTLMSGQSASLNTTFYAGQQYRIFICSQEVLGKVTFRVLDESGKVLFDSKVNGSPDFWDFNIESTQKLTIDVITPASDSPNSIIPSGCVTLMVGFKKG